DNLSSSSAVMLLIIGQSFICRASPDCIRTCLSPARTSTSSVDWQYSPPVVGGGPVQGVISSPATHHPLTLHFLWEIKGVPHQAIRDFARENTFQAEGTSQIMRVRVLDPVLLLHGKIRNAVDIEQNQPEKPRQDVKHVAMLGLCVPRFLEDMCAEVP